MIFSINKSDVIGLRNGADVIFRQFFAIFNIYGFYYVGFVVILTFLLTYYFYSKENGDKRLNSRYYLLMFLESFFYALVMILVVSRIGRYFMAIGDSIERRNMIILALGAGVYEEFIFRVVLISGFTFFFRNLLRINSITSTILSVISASLIFSYFHYIGPYGEEFQIGSFTARFGAGVFLSILYTVRGYGVTAYTHTIYDLIVIIL
jgi:hypothetical protein